MKVIITDDEIQVRKGLRMKIDWEEQGFQIVGEASNGLEALDLLKTMEVNIVLTDMRMPIMDGVELATRCQQEFPSVKVIVLSGYSDFEFVRSSMKQGVRDYLLKPVAPDELQEVLNKVRKEIEEEKRKQGELAQMSRFVHSYLQEVQEQYLLLVVKGEILQLNLINERLRQLQLSELTNEHVKVQFLTVEIRESRNNSNRLKELWNPFQMVCRELAKDFSGTYVFFNPGYANIAHFLKIEDGQPKNQMSKLIKKIQQNIKTFLELETVIGIGNVVQGISEFKIGYISSLLSWSQSQLGAQSQIIDSSVIKEDLFEFTPNFEKKLTNSIENIDFESFKNNLFTVMKETENQSVLSFSFIANRVLFLLGSLAKKYDVETKEIQQILWECQQSIWELNSQGMVLEYLVQLAKLIIEKVRMARFSNGALIESIQHYLNENYSNEISLSSLSELFHINSAYLSETFKSKVGQNFSDYLVSLRMNKARHFLKDTELKIIDVANLVGYSNSGYFSTVFKKHFGQTPLEFRNSVKEI